MKKAALTLVAAILLATLACSTSYAAQGDIWLAGYHLLRLKTPADANAFQQRVDVVQSRANELLELSSKIPKVEVRKERGRTDIYAGNKVFITVTPADAKACGTTVDKLARAWAHRLRTILPEATPIKH